MKGATSHQLLLRLPGLCLPMSAVISPVVPSVIPGVSAPVSLPVMPGVAAVLIGPVSVPLPIRIADPFAIPAQTADSDGRQKHMSAFHRMAGPQGQSRALHSISKA